MRPRSARAQTPPDGWPARPVRVIYPTGPGGPSDNFRLYADHLKAAFGQSFVGENMAGGSGAIGATAVARAAPDGYTLLVGSNSATVLAPLVFEKHPINMKRDFVRVALLFNYRFLLVMNPELPVKSLAEFIAYAKAHRESSTMARRGSAPAAIWSPRCSSSAPASTPCTCPTRRPRSSCSLPRADTCISPSTPSAMRAASSRAARCVPPRRDRRPAGRRAMPDVPNFDELGFPGFSGLFVSTSALAPAGHAAGDRRRAQPRNGARASRKPDVKIAARAGFLRAARLFSVGGDW